jgi:hypothetical protein
MKNELTAYKITLANGTNFTTSMAWNVTLTMAIDYYFGRKIGGSSIGHMVRKVEQV